MKNKAARRYVIEFNSDAVLFRGAESVFRKELKRLEARIDKQLTKRQGHLSTLRAQLDGVPKELQPGHPLNTKRNGNLNARGVEVIYRLFDGGRSPLAAAFLFRISRTAALRHYKRWQGAGALHRKKSQLAPLPFYP